MWRRAFIHLLGLALGITPGVAYAAWGMVGPGGAAFLIGLGGAVGVALTLPCVSPRRVVHTLAELTPLVWPVAAFVPPPDEERPPPQPPPPREASSKPAADPVADPAWLTSDVLALARLIRTTGEVELLPILGDALQDAGCTEAEILGWCRAGECVDRVIDRLLGPPQPADTAAAPDQGGT